MPIVNKISNVINSFSDAEMELLIRRYIGTMQARTKQGTRFQFIVQSNYNEEHSRGYWTIGSRYSEAKTEVEGEILSETITEFNRRSGFKSTLMLIEATSETIEEEV